MKNCMVLLLLVWSCSVTRASFLVDNAETGTDTNSLGGVWLKFDDGVSTTQFTPDVSPGHAGSYCRSFAWTLKTNTNPYATALTGLNLAWTGVNLSGFFGVRFYARGTGRYNIGLATDQTRSGNNHYAKAVNLTSDWTLYELPYSQFAQFWGTPQAWDPTTIYAFVITPVAAKGMTGEIWIDDIEFYLSSEAHPVVVNKILLEPKTDQVGYLPDAHKPFCVAANSAAAGDTFLVVDASDVVAYSGILSGAPINDTASTGEYVWKGEFSGLNAPGTYRVRLNGRESFPFTISDSVYLNVLKDALRCFYLIRCGLAENDPVSGIVRPACHTTDAMIRGDTGWVDATGGWHNAGDKGKFVPEIAASVAWMLWLYELRQEQFQGFTVAIPESGNGVSDLLDEARWGLNWLLKMQNPDGTVFHKADSEPLLYTCPDLPPDQDPFVFDRYVEFQKSDLPQIPSTIDAADLAAVMSQAARVFQQIDTAFAAKCLNAAKKSWQWAGAHQGIGQTDPYYFDTVATQEFLWAKGEMARSLDAAMLRTQFNNDLDVTTPTPAYWNDPHLFGCLALYFDSHTDAVLKTKIRNRVINLCNEIVAVSDSSGYGVALRPWEYWWESNEVVLTRANCLLFGYEMTGNDLYRSVALSQLHYLLGLNSLSKSFVMGHGTQSMQHPYHWIYTAYGKAIPGWTAGGANGCNTGGDVLLMDVILAGTPKAKCYVDQWECGLGSWASNEGETSLNAALVFTSGYLSAGLRHTPNAIGQTSGASPKDHSLVQNFPNPFNPATHIAFRLSKRSHVAIRIFTVLGQLVRVLVDDIRGPGEYHVVWDGRDETGNMQPSGAYFYQMKAGGFAEAKKMILLR